MAQKTALMDPPAKIEMNRLKILILFFPAQKLLSFDQGCASRPDQVLSFEQHRQHVESTNVVSNPVHVSGQAIETDRDAVHLFDAVTLWAMPFIFFFIFFLRRLYSGKLSYLQTSLLKEGNTN